MAAVAVVMGVLTACLAIPFAGLVGVAAKDVSKGMVNLPESLEAKDLSQKTRIYDVNGNLIASLYDQNRINVPLKSISRPMVKAIVAIEDYRFYDHGALDLKGTLRAFVTNQANGGSVQGGSSITQQMVKQTLLYQAETDEEQRGRDRGDVRPQDPRAALRHRLREEPHQGLDPRALPQHRLLRRRRLRRPVGRAPLLLQERQASSTCSSRRTLAGLVKNPVGYDPVDNPERAESRRNVVLDRLAQLGVLSEKKAERLKEHADRGDAQDRERRQRLPAVAGAVLLRLRRQLAAQGPGARRHRQGASYGAQERRPRRSRPRSTSTCRRPPTSPSPSHVYPTDQAIGGLAMVEPGTGDVRALAQSRPMGKDKAAGETYLNYVVPKKYGDANGFQAGSTFKVFVLAAAINQGIPLSTTHQLAAGRCTSTTRSSRPATAPTPATARAGTSQNSTGAGTYDLYSGTQHSVNTFFAQLETQTGMCEPLQLAADMGVKVPQPQQVPSWILGVSDANPLEMAQAYATFAARGLHCDPRPVTQVLDSQGQTLKDFSSQCEQVMPGATADAVNDDPARRDGG